MTSRTEQQHRARYGAPVREVLCSIAFGVALALAPGGSSFGALDDGTPGTPTGEYVVTSAALTVSNVRVFFENQRPEITVMRNQPLDAYVEMKYAGSGLLSGTWVVDDRLLSKVNLHVVPAKTAVIPVPVPPGVPTFDPGTHRLQFVITVPAGIKPVETTYFVTAEEYPRPVLRLISPEDKSTIDYVPVTFRWESGLRAESWLIEFFKKRGGKSIFAVRTTVPDIYAMPASVLRETFLPGTTYSWKVRAMSGTDEVKGESAVSEFTFKEE